MTKDLTDENIKLMEQVNTLQECNTFWAHECEKLASIVWYKMFLIVSCALNLTFISSIIGLWLWLK